MLQTHALFLPVVHVDDYREMPCLLMLRGVVDRARFVLHCKPTLSPDGKLTPHPCLHGPMLFYHNDLCC